MVNTRSILATGLLLLSSSSTSFVLASPAGTTTSSRNITSTTTIKSSTSTKASTTTTPTASPTCPPEFEGILRPTPGTVITQIDDGDYNPTYIPIIYCSGAYFKTSSIDGSVFLSGPDPDDIRYGQLLIKDQKPDDRDASPGFYSYRFNATVFPESGSYRTGKMTLSVYETQTGYYNPMNYAISSVNVTFAVKQVS